MRISPLFLLCFSSLAACYGSSGSNNPEVNSVHYPTSVLTVGDGTLTLVTNTALDRKYDSGHLSVVDVDDGRVTEAGVLTGLFGGGMALSTKTNDRGERYLVLPTRDNDLLELFALSLDDEITIRRLDTYSDFGVRPMTGAPLNAVAIAEGFLVSHPSTSTVSYWFLDTTTDTLTYGCSSTLNSGVHMLAKHPAAERVYVTSRLGSSIAVVRVESAGWYGDPSTRSCRVKVQSYVNVGGRNSHGLAFDQSGQRLYLTGLADGDLRMFDVSLDSTNEPRNESLASVWIGQNAGLVRVDPASGDVFVAVTEERQILRLNGATLDIVDRLRVSGRPYDLDFANGANGEPMIVASYFTDHTVGLISLTDDGMVEASTLEAAP